MVRIADSAQVLQKGADSIHEAIPRAGIATSIGLYFYRFEKPPDDGLGYSKIDEVSGRKGVLKHKHRCCLAG